MCLSTVYTENATSPQYLCKNIARVKISGEEIELYDLMGRKTVISGFIEDIDLMENTILIKEKGLS